MSDFDVSQPMTTMPSFGEQKLNTDDGAGPEGSDRSFSRIMDVDGVGGDAAAVTKAADMAIDELKEKLKDINLSDTDFAAVFNELYIRGETDNFVAYDANTGKFQTYNENGQAVGNPKTRDEFQLFALSTMNLTMTVISHNMFEAAEAAGGAQTPGS